MLHVVRRKGKQPSMVYLRGNRLLNQYVGVASSDGVQLGLLNGRPADTPSLGKGGGGDQPVDTRGHGKFRAGRQ